MIPGEEETGAVMEGVQPHSSRRGVDEEHSTAPQHRLDLEPKSTGPTRPSFNEARECLKHPCFW